jgi:Kef-type K+ transport system membrane component KefB
MMPGVSFGNLLAVALIAVAIPLGLGLAPRLRLPAAVFEIAAGILVGPSVLRVVTPDTAVRVASVLGLGFLLFLGGLEIETERLRGLLLRRALLGFGASVGLALAIGAALGAAGLVGDPLLVAVILLATSLGVIVPVLKDAGEAGSTFGQTVIAGASVADFGAIVLLSLFFSRQAGAGSSQAVLLAGFGLLAVLVAVAVARAERVRRLAALLRALQDTTAQIRVRAAFLLLVAFVAVAEQLGLEVILGAFLAGVVVSVVDRDEGMTHPLFRIKLEAIGFGVFIPIFFVSSGMAIDVGALIADPATLILVPLFLGALLAVRGLPAILYRGALGGRRAAAAGLLQATSLPFIVAATQIGTELGVLRPATSAALVAAGLLSVLVFPVSALVLMRRHATLAGAPPSPAVEPHPGRATPMDAM